MTLTRYEELYRAAYKTYEQLGVDKGWDTLQPQIAAAGPESHLWAAAFHNARYDFIQQTPDLRMLGLHSETTAAVATGVPGGLAGVGVVVLLVVIALVAVFARRA